MKKLRDLLHITEEVNPTKWILSWKSPDFQVAAEYESNEISADEAKNLLLFLSSLDKPLTDKDKFVIEGCKVCGCGKRSEAKGAQGGNGACICSCHSTWNL